MGVLWGWASPPKGIPPFLAGDTAWVRAQVSRLSLEEKIGQLLMVPAYSDPARSNRAQLERWIRDYHLGGLIFMQGSPTAQLWLTHAYQRLSSIPLLLAMDAEWGPSMRLDSLPRFPSALTLAAVPQDSLVYHVARSIAYQCRRLGVHLNFAPVADVNSNPQNPVIGFRAFGADPHRVTQLSLLFMHGLQEGGVAAVAKHFPGHGDTYEDSHYALPVLPHDSARLAAVELYPFRHLIDEGVTGVMVGHLLVPALDTFTATVSRRVVTELLRQKLGFRGLVFSDALNMKAVSLYFPPGELEVRALEAGIDVLLYVENVPVVFRAIHQAVLEGRLSEAEIDEKVERLFLLKAHFRLFERSEPPPLENLLSDLWADSLLRPLREAYTQAVTLLQNRQGLLPLGHLGQKKLLYVQVGYERPAPFYRYLSQYAAMDAVVVPRWEGLNLDSLTQALQDYSTLIVGVFGLHNNPRRGFGVRPRLLDLLCEVQARQREVILCVFDNPYALSFFGEETATLLAYQEDTLIQWKAAAVIFGASPPVGRLPIPVPMRYPRFVTYDLTPYRPLYPYARPYAFRRTDSLLQAAVRERLTPSLAVTVIYRDTVVYNQSVGRFTYDPASPAVSPTHSLYDVASLTKVFVTTLAAMDLYERGRLLLMQPLGEGVPAWRSFPLAKLTPYQLLTHTAGYPPVLPLLKEALQESTVFSDSLTSSHTWPLSRFRYLRTDYPRQVWQQIRQYAPSPTRKPVYSDIGFVVLGRYIEKLTGQALETYVMERFYRPMGLYRMVFRPGLECLDSLCVPTEVDTVWRKDTLRGYVHDPTAALLGGSAGHAGLFASANDLAKLLWMLQKGGEYAGFCYFSPQTVRTFTREMDRLGRGLGWDKPSPGKNSTVPAFFSPATFGHLGFTGCAAWCDPERQLVVVILSNRVYPTSEDARFVQQNLRRQILEAIGQDLGLW